MKFKETAYLMVGAFLLPVTACTTIAQSGNPVAPEELTASSTDTQQAAPLTAQSQVTQERPATATGTISIEGEATEIELELFDAVPLPFTTYVPAEEFTKEVTATDEGNGVRFYFSPTGTPNKDAYIHVFFPKDAPTSEAMSEMLTGAQGLLTSNGWQVIDRTDSTEYPWAKERITYQQSTAEGAYTGTVFVGEHEGRSFLAFTHYPLEYGDGFEPRAAIVLENLEFRD